jgi:hypothetical protein
VVRRCCNSGQDRPEHRARAGRPDQPQRSAEHEAAEIGWDCRDGLQCNTSARQAGRKPLECRRPDHQRSEYYQQNKARRAQHIRVEV